MINRSGRAAWDDPRRRRPSIFVLFDWVRLRRSGRSRGRSIALHGFEQRTRASGPPTGRAGGPNHSGGSLATGERIVVGVRSDPVPEVHAVPDDIDGAVLDRDAHGDAAGEVLPPLRRRKGVGPQGAMLGVGE